MKLDDATRARRYGRGGARGDPPSAVELIDALRSHPLLAAAARRRWIELLPHLSADERRDLWSILADSSRELASLEPGGAEGRGEL